MSTNGRRMRGQRFLLMSDSVRLYVYRELWKSLTLFVKMIFRISKPLIRLGIRRATFSLQERQPFWALPISPNRGISPRGRLFIGNTTTPQSPSPTNISVTPNNPKRVSVSLNHSPFTIHHSPFTIHYSPLTVLRSPKKLSIQNASAFPATIHHSPFTIHRSPAPIFTKFSAKFVRVYCKKVWKF